MAEKALENSLAEQKKLFLQQYRKWVEEVGPDPRSLKLSQIDYRIHSPVGIECLKRMFQASYKKYVSISAENYDESLYIRFGKSIQEDIGELEEQLEKKRKLLAECE